MVSLRSGLARPTKYTRANKAQDATYCSQAVPLFLIAQYALKINPSTLPTREG